MGRARGGGAIAALAVALAGCGLPGMPVTTAPPTATLSIRNQDSSRVVVRWTGPSSGDVEVEACDTFELPLVPGAWTVDVRTPAAEVALPIGVQPVDGGLTVIGIDAEGRIAFGSPPDNPLCANH
jgi:hypothetical protein